MVVGLGKTYIDAINPSGTSAIYYNEQRKNLSD